jgi:hypothetical protein
MSGVKFPDMQARYAQGRPELEKAALDAVKQADLGGLKEVISSVPGMIDEASVAIAKAASNTAGPLRDRLLQPNMTELAAKVERYMTASKQFETTFVSGQLLGGLREAAADEDRGAFAKALVDAVFARGISQAEWSALLGKFSALKDAAGDLSMVSNRAAKTAIRDDLIKLIYQPLIEGAKTLS